MPDRVAPTRPRRPGRGLVIALEGASGAGKSTTTAALARRRGWVPLAEAYDRLRPRPSLLVRTERALRATERALFAEEARRWREAQWHAARGSIVLADTGFLGPLTYTAGLASLRLAAPRVLSALLRTAARQLRAGRWGLPDLVIYLACPNPLRRARASRDPVRHPPQLLDRHAAVGEFEGRFYRTVVARHLGRRFRRVRSDRALPTVVAAIARVAARPRPAPLEAGAARAILAELAVRSPKRARARGAGRPATRRSPRSRNR